MPQARILVVEDEAIVAKDIQLRLEQMDYEVPKVAHTGPESICFAEEVSPDLILMDVQLPKMNGLDVTKAIRSCDGLKRTRIVATTAYARKADKDKAITTGCDACISKPIDTRDVRGVVAGLMKRVKVD